ncbi:MAG: 5/3-nucleotidase [Thermotogaceae bacterium]|jgi:5'-nucleotidase|nr:5/3-nucleotidase [Thermotogaceae bacterium]MDN5338077.1 5/3-nucleotidase [Thermotogaceae bacterium]
MDELRILVTNDDGIMSPGIATLVNYLKKITNEITVVAPDIERSATGHAITIRTPLWVKEVSVNKDFLGYAVNGTPADCVKLALQALKRGSIDLVISGINNGANLGTDILYSGTVSGALEGALMGKPSIAISCVNSNNPNFESAAEFLINFLKVFDIKKLPEFTALNINVPSRPYSELKGWKITRQSKRRYNDYFEARKDPFGNTYYWMLGEVIEDDPSDDSDYMAVKNGYVSITPISVFLTDQKLFEELKEVEKTWR